MLSWHYSLPNIFITLNSLDNSFNYTEHTIDNILLMNQQKRKDYDLMLNYNIGYFK